MPNTSTQFKKGMTPWNKNLKGIHLSPDSQFQKGMTPWNKGLERPEICGDKHPNWTGKRICPGCKGLKTRVSLECQKCARSKKADRLRKVGKKAHIMMKEKIKKLGYYHSIESRKKMSLFRVNNPQMQIHDTKIELAMEAVLIKYRIPFLKQVPLCGVTISDFYIESHNIAIFCDGCYWHGCKLHRSIDKAVELNKRQNLVMMKNNISVLRFWEHEINENIEGCVERIINLINIKK